MKKVSCVIPTYNEKPRIEDVLRVVSRNNFIEEIIVVDDGSSDGTKDVVKNFSNVRLIEHNINQGKSKAVYTGIINSNGQFIILLDSDLINLVDEDINNLLEPVVYGYADVSISLRKQHLIWQMIGIDFLSGERAFSKKIIEKYLEEIAFLPGFGLEVFFNKKIIDNKHRIKIVPFKKAISPYKYEKSGILDGIKGDIDMFRVVTKIVSLGGTITQIREMRRLRV